MKNFNSIVVGAFLFLATVQHGESTVLSATMLMSFMGGFLMGKVTLGTLLMVLNGLQNQPAAISPTVRPRGSSELDISSTAVQTHDRAIENRIRDKFLRQLGEMDPLNCLPKVFCELSATSGQNSFFQQDVETSQQDDEVEDDQSDGDQSNQSQSDEESEVEKAKRQKMEALVHDDQVRLEDEALEALADDGDDPMDYLFILRDKQRLKPHLSQMSHSYDNRYFIEPNYESNILKKSGDGEGESRRVKRTKSGASIDDIFADDPFFDEFRENKFSASNPNHPILQGIKNYFPGLAKWTGLNRQRRSVSSKNKSKEKKIRMKYKMAAKVGEKFKNKSKCQRVFSTCPFEASQIMAMVTTMKQIGAQTSTTKSTFSNYKINPSQKRMKAKLENLENLRNTLFAIESINNATLVAKRGGNPVSLNAILQDMMDTRHEHYASSIMDEFASAAKSIESSHKGTHSNDNDNDDKTKRVIIKHSVPREGRNRRRTQRSDEDDDEDDPIDEENITGKKAKKPVQKEILRRPPVQVATPPAKYSLANRRKTSTSTPIKITTTTLPPGANSKFSEILEDDEIDISDDDKALEDFLYAKYSSTTNVGSIGSASNRNRKIRS